MRLKTEPIFQFEKKPYTESASIEEIEAIKNSVSIYNSQIIYFKDLPVVSPFSTNIAFDKIDQLAKQMGPCGLILDVSVSDRPDAATRRALNDRHKKISKNIRQVAFVTKSNIVVRTIIKFVMFQSVLESFTINTTFEEAEASINKILND